jgi:NitT/TauT family transport system substrate-binding protein
MGFAHAATPIKFQLDWRFEGPSALFLVPTAKGYFKDAGLDVTVDSGNGSGGAVTRVASGTYDMGFADLAALMEFHANNPDAPNKPVAVMMVYNNTPASVMALKKSGIKTAADLAGKKLGAPVFDAGRRAFPIFAKANGIENVTWTAMDPPLRETMLVRGDVDAITGFTFTSLLNIEARGVPAANVTVLAYPDNGVKLYGNAIIASPKLIKENPEAIKAFLAAFAKGAKDVVADPAQAIEAVKARDGIINTKLETRRLQLAIDTVINSPSAREEGFGQVKAPRLALMASQVSDAFNTKSRVKAADVWNGSFLPSAAVLDILPKAK